MKRYLFFLTILLSFLVFPKDSFAKGKYYKQTLTIKGKKRSYYIYLPSSYKKGKKYPTVIAFHGYLSDANGFRWFISPDKLADKYNYIMIYPNGINKSWNAGRGVGSKSKADDLTFAAALIDVVKARHPVDPNKLYAMGFSNGAQMVSLINCKFGNKITAGAMVAHTLNIKGCNPKYKLPMLMIHGDKDKAAPYKGGGKLKIKSHQDSIKFFRESYGISSKSKTVLAKKTVNCKSYSDKKNKTEVQSCVAYGGGHTWPGGREFNVKVLGKANKELDATEYIFKFFKKYSGKPKKNIASNKKKITYKSKSNEKLISKSIKINKTNLNYYYTNIGSLPNDSELSMTFIFGPNEFSNRDLSNIFESEKYSKLYRNIIVFPKINPDKYKEKDFDKIQAIYNQINKKYNNQIKRVFILGYSSGGKIAQKLYFNNSNFITAGAFIGYSFKKSPIKTPIKRSTFIIHSKQDKIFPYRGNKKKNYLSYKENLQTLRDRIDSFPDKEDMINEKTYKCQMSKYHNDLEINSCYTEWGNNSVPGSKFKYPKKYKPTMNKLAASKLIFEFFHKQKHNNFTIIRQR